MPSSYFSTPADHLDPALFEGDHLKDYVCEVLLDSLHDALRLVGFKNPEAWSYAWLAGSGVSYQWEADRGNGDLDVLFGVEYAQFLEDNPSFPRLSRQETAKYIDDQLKVKVWPKYDHYNIDGKIFEVTFFWNYTTGEDIRNIHPYAAYSLDRDTWDVPPPSLPRDPKTLYPQEWFDFTDRDFESAASAESVGSTGYAREMWQNIHGRRSEAFSDTGMGYEDFRNFRWQRAKELGTVDILRGLVEQADAEDAKKQEELYGFALDGPSAIVTRAAMRYGSPRYNG